MKFTITRNLLTILALLLSFIDSKACSCLEVKDDFYSGFGHNSITALVRVEEMVNDNGDFYTGRYITILDNYNNDFPENTLIVRPIGSCDISLGQFQTGDTLVVANLQNNEEKGFSIMSYCNTPFLRIKNSKNNGLNLTEIKEKVLGIITNVIESAYNGLKVYPNPFKDVLKIEGTETNGMPYRMEIINVAGLLIREEDFLGSINLALLNPGIYFIKISNIYGDVLIKENILKQ